MSKLQGSCGNSACLAGAQAQIVGRDYSLSGRHFVSSMKQLIVRVSCEISALWTKLRCN